MKYFNIEVILNAWCSTFLQQGGGARRTRGFLKFYIFYQVQAQVHVNKFDCTCKLDLLRSSTSMIHVLYGQSRFQK